MNQTDWRKIVYKMMGTWLGYSENMIETWWEHKGNMLVGDCCCCPRAKVVIVSVMGWRSNWLQQIHHVSQFTQQVNTNTQIKNSYTSSIPADPPANQTLTWTSAWSLSVHVVTFNNHTSALEVQSQQDSFQLTEDRQKAKNEDNLCSFGDETTFWCDKGVVVNGSKNTAMSLHKYNGFESVFSLNNGSNSTALTLSWPELLVRLSDC